MLKTRKIISLVLIISIISLSATSSKASSLISSPDHIEITLSNIPINTSGIVLKLNFDPSIITIKDASTNQEGVLTIIDNTNKAVAIVGNITPLPTNLIVRIYFNSLNLGVSELSVNEIRTSLSANGQLLSQVGSVISATMITVSIPIPTPTPTPTSTPDFSSIPALSSSEVQLQVSSIPSGSKELNIDVSFRKLTLIIKNVTSSTLSSLKTSISKPFLGNNSEYDYQTIKITNSSSDLPESVTIKLSLGGITFGETLLSIPKILINGIESLKPKTSFDQNYIQIYEPDSSPYIALTPTPTASPAISFSDQLLYTPELGIFFSMFTNGQENNLLKGSNISIEFFGYRALDLQSIDYIYSDSRSIIMIDNEIIKDTDLSLSSANINIPLDASDSSTLRFNLTDGDKTEFMINTISPVLLNTKRGGNIINIDSPIIDKVDISNSKDSYIFKISGSNFISDRRLFFLDSGVNTQINNNNFSVNSLSITPQKAMATIGSIKISPNGKLMKVKVLTNAKPLKGFINIVTPSGAYSKSFSTDEISN